MSRSTITAERPRRPVYGAAGAPSLQPVDRLLLVIIGIIPWLPRPTISGAARVLAPLAVIAILGLFAMWALGSPSLRPTTGSQLGLLVVAMTLVLGIYGVQITLGARWGELPHYASRALMVAGLIAIVEWLAVRGLTVRHIFQALFVGFASLSVLILFEGVTGTGLFERVDPPRTFGIRMPFYKSPGVPRSFGELGIIASAAVAYALVYRDRLRPLVRYAALGLMLAAVVVGQSRNLYLAVGLVVLAYVVHRRGFRVRLAAVIAAAALLAPLAVSVAVPVLESTDATAAILGERTLRRNIDDRFIFMDAALDLLAADAVQSLGGYGRAAWSDHIEEVRGIVFTLHNNYLAQAVFLGLVAGLISMGVLYVLPTWRLIRRDPEDERERLMVFLAAVGAFVSLNFYEGWFSPTLMVVLASLWYLSTASSRAREPWSSRPSERV